MTTQEERRADDVFAGDAKIKRTLKDENPCKELQKNLSSYEWRLSVAHEIQCRAIAYHGTELGTVQKGLTATTNWREKCRGASSS